MTTPKAMSLDELKSEIDGIIVLLTSDGQYPTETGYVDYRIVEKAKSQILNLVTHWADEQRVEAIEQAKAEVNKYSIHQPKGQPKGTLARRNLMKRLDRITLTGGEVGNG